jgi:ubiquinone/menaquinone biosynthesis C-methylase UbiE
MGSRDGAADDQSLIEARFAAQRIAFGPLIFQCTRVLRDLGILEAVRANREGLTLGEICARVDVPRYGVLVLLEGGLAAGVVRAEGDRFVLTKTGACILRDELTRINMDFVHHGCYQAFSYLEDAIREGKPAGLHKVFGDWDTIYPALSVLPQAARDSWFAWNHYYSDAAFPRALPIVFERPHRTLLDVGGNTGKWAIQCARYSPQVAVTILDLPGQAAVAARNVAAQGLQGRIAIQSCDLLDHSQALPAGFDAIWMSQFLVCFAESDVRSLLARAAAAMAPESRLYILDTFWDRQDHEISTFCLQASSLYFTCLANGCSRMYKASDITAMVESAGMIVERQTETLGICSSLMICRRR